MLQAVNISCVHRQQPLFVNLSFLLVPGEVLLVTGSNGSGKSTLLRLLSGLSFPEKGEVRWKNRPVEKIQTEYGEDLHYVGHTNGIQLGLTVQENLHLASRLTLSCSPAFGEVPEALQLHAIKNTLAKHLSVGQKRRIALARLFLLPKKLWILDEPLTALDMDTQAGFLTKLKAHVKGGGIVIMSSHGSVNVEGIMIKTLRLGSC